ncbi:PREDICTED: chromodomain-helicase-DNA-binding protein 8-like [Amphimedon queenslandica]|uniref:Uncharacterized protein n=1 Tax=Amphimedon queenslandica TaxID=400682 RepID=A0AAN0JRM5_AMPQE|nr:PREDICTED: chromodomain-helicase-DNA-binding protein 8-like [Amphimedon queenslandica]|eukprot:XP_019859652.1 PREDICTED: chromodomain-helicase-DNA-binding protein 8-like [Amphimedon queenslandica]
MVKVYRLITTNSYKREMFDRASLKLGLDKAVLQSMNTQQQASGPPQLSKSEIENLLKRGAYSTIMDSDDAANQLVPFIYRAYLYNGHSFKLSFLHSGSFSLRL